MIEIEPKVMSEDAVLQEHKGMHGIVITRLLAHMLAQKLVVDAAVKWEKDFDEDSAHSLDDCVVPPCRMCEANHVLLDAVEEHKKDLADAEG